MWGVGFVSILIAGVLLILTVLYIQREKNQKPLFVSFFLHPQKVTD